jgi:hypothetical protein
MSVMKDVFSEYTETYQTRKESEMSLMEYLDLCGYVPVDVEIGEQALPALSH